jgi:hypothetical protein
MACSRSHRICLPRAFEPCRSEGSLSIDSGNFYQFQDNDLILVDDPSIVAKFEANFDAIWARGTNAGALPSLERGGAR